VVELGCALLIKVASVLTVSVVGNWAEAMDTVPRLMNKTNAPVPMRIDSLHTELLPVLPEEACYNVLADCSKFLFFDRAGFVSLQTHSADTKDW
jgi:hypothetical protein